MFSSQSRVQHQCSHHYCSEVLPDCKSTMYLSLYYFLSEGISCSISYHSGVLFFPRVLPVLLCACSTGGPVLSSISSLPVIKLQDILQDKNLVSSPPTCRIICLATVVVWRSRALLMKVLISGLSPPACTSSYEAPPLPTSSPLKPNLTTNPFYLYYYCCRRFYLCVQR